MVMFVFVRIITQLCKSGIFSKLVESHHFCLILHRCFYLVIYVRAGGKKKIIF